MPGIGGKGIFKMKILVTGASGFIGSHLAERLVKEGHDVRVLVRGENPNKLPKNRRDSLDLLNKLDLKIVKGDFLDKESLVNALKGVEVVFHLGAIARPMAIPKKLYFDVNEKGTRNLFEAINEKKIKKIVMMSSVSAVGTARKGVPLNEESERLPVDVYGESKLAQEKVAEEFIKEKSLPIVMLRPPMVFGPRDVEMLRLFKAVDKRFFPLSSENKCLEFLYVENLVEACFLAWKKGKTGEKYHITNGEHYSINQVINSISRAENKSLLPLKFPRFFFVAIGHIVETISKIINIHPPFQHNTIDWMTGKLWYGDPSKAMKELGYKPIVSLDEGTKRTFEYYKRSGFL